MGDGRLASPGTDFQLAGIIAAAVEPLAAGGGSLPADRWQPGWRVIDEYPIALPADLPPGSHTLTTGLYQPTGQRLPAEGSELRLGDVQVVTGS